MRRLQADGSGFYDLHGVAPLLAGAETSTKIQLRPPYDNLSKDSRIRRMTLEICHVPGAIHSKSARPAPINVALIEWEDSNDDITSSTCCYLRHVGLG